MGTLHPTLWRTCKMLAGKKRVLLLREIFKSAGRNVTQLGKAVGIKRSDASQELRRIQSRGILSSKRRGVHLIYSMKPDPQVPSAAPILHAIQSSLRTIPAKRDLEICVIATNLSNERRIQIVRELLHGPMPLNQIQLQTGIPEVSLAKHLHVLRSSGFIRKAENEYRLLAPRHPLAQALIRMVESHQTSASS